jgi:anti-sigma factor RsiW
VIHAQAQDLLGAYAAGAVDAAEREEIERHLAQCGACRETVAALIRAASLLSYAVPGEEPPSYLREDVVRALRHEAPPAGRPGVRPVLAGAAGIVLVFGAALVWQLIEVRHLQEAVSAMNATLALQRQALSQMAPGGTIVAELRPTAAARGAQGVAVLRTVDGRQVLVITVTGLPPVPAPSVYQAWLLRDGARTSAGVVRVSKDGTGVLRYEASGDLHRYQGVGITREPDGPAPAPRGPRVLSATI